LGRFQKKINHSPVGRSRNPPDIFPAPLSFGQSFVIIDEHICSICLN
jgi:hypothetical protein